ncbi:PHD finger protein ALFIN-LIKE 6-like [Capsicum annuum]|uniref:PHD finger protein ALFIN-LIKE 6-like n=1 Tax=Capsicum annuum TaxID=4072 RepID=UPI001FB06107|nr:PHD finger protein ALFIN-LIKE 6-like [Capsicum annuum]
MSDDDGLGDGIGDLFEGFNAVLEDLPESSGVKQIALGEGKRPGLYAYPSGRWEIRLPAHLSEALPHSRLHKLPKEETDKNAWLAQVAADSDTWLFSVTFYLCSIYGWQAKSSSRLTKVTGDIGYKPIKDLKRKQEGKKAITKQVLPVKTRSKALGIQTRAQTRKSSIKITS